MSADGSGVMVIYYCIDASLDEEHFVYFQRRKEDRQGSRKETY